MTIQRTNNQPGKETPKEMYAVIFDNFQEANELLANIQELGQTAHEECPQLVQLAEYVDKFLTKSNEDTKPTLPLYHDSVQVLFQCLAYLLMIYRMQVKKHKDILDETVTRHQQEIHDIRSSLIMTLQSEINLLNDKAELSELVERMQNDTKQ